MSCLGKGGVVTFPENSYIIRVQFINTAEGPDGIIVLEFMVHIPFSEMPNNIPDDWMAQYLLRPGLNIKLTLVANTNTVIHK